MKMNPGFFIKSLLSQYSFLCYRPSPSTIQHHRMYKRGDPFLNRMLYSFFTLPGTYVE